MKREELREWWLVTDPAPICRMLDGKFAILIIGPSNSAVARDDWKFGFQVHGERDIRWCQPEQLELAGSALIELPVA
jgi:hypothetical protein